jgi:hypothetical protein
MTNMIRGEAQLGATGPVLVFDIEAFCQMEEALGLDTQAILAKLSSGVSFRTMREVVRVGMLNRKPDATLADATAAMEAAGLETLVSVVGKALEGALPSAGGKGPTTRTPRRAGAGDGKNS